MVNMHIIENLEDSNYVLNERDCQDITIFYKSLSERIDSVIHTLLKYDPEWKKYNDSQNYEWTINGSNIEVNGKYNGLYEDARMYFKQIPVSIFSIVNFEKDLINQKQKAEELAEQEQQQFVKELAEQEYNRKTLRRRLVQQLEKEIYERLKKKYDNG